HHRSRYRDRHRNAWILNRSNLDGWRLVRIAFTGIEVAVRHHHAIIDFLSRQKSSISLLCLAVRRYRPYDFFISKVGWNTEPIDPSLPPRQKVCRLAGVRTARLHVVLRPRLDDNFFFPIAIEVPEHKIERAVRILDPAFEIRHHVLARVEPHLRKL